MQKQPNPFDAIYNRNPKNAPWGYARPDREIISVIKELSLPPAARVLDLGCGNGKNSFYLKKHGLEVYGIDISRVAIKITRERMKSRNFIVADAAGLPYKDNYFDLIIDMGLLHVISVKKRKSIRDEICRTLKSGGYYFMSEFLLPKNERPSDPFISFPVYQINKRTNSLSLGDNLMVWGFTLQQIKKIFSKKFLMLKKWSANGRINALMLKRG